jgi:hypothetical protein
MNLRRNNPEPCIRRWVKTGKTRDEQMFSASLLTTDIAESSRRVRLVAMMRLVHRSKRSLFNHLVGSGEYCWRDGDTQRRGGPEVDD